MITGPTAPDLATCGIANLMAKTRIRMETVSAAIVTDLTHVRLDGERS